MSDEVIEGQLRPPTPTGDAAVLAAFRELTDWTDEDVLHYVTCRECDPRDGDYTWYCDNSPVGKRQREQEATRRPYSEPVRPQDPLPAALRRVGEQIIQDAKARVPLGGVITGTAGGPYCGVCGAPAEHEPHEYADGIGFTTMPGVLRCPNRCDPRKA